MSRYLGIGLLILAFSSPCLATTIDPLTFEQLVLGADMVAIVECTTAGGIVAKYRVVESFKGPKAGSEVAIRTAVNYWEPQFPIALVGKRSFVTAYKSPPSTMMSTSFGGPVPLWWRKIPADYRTPLFQGRMELPSAGKPDKLAMEGDEWGSLDDLRKKVRELVATPADKQELLLLKSLGKKYALRMRDRPADANEFLSRLDSAETVDQAVEAVLQHARSDKENNARVLTALDQAGGEKTLKLLNDLPKEKWPLDEESLKYTKMRIERRLHPPAPATAPAGNDEEDEESALRKKPPSAEQLKALRDALNDKESMEYGRALYVLSIHDPATVADYLVKWKQTGDDWREHDMGYALGSTFASLCGKDRATHLRTLLKAEDPFIRVAGAVYLCYEDEKAGSAELKKLKALPGDPGAWAALNLARRGDLDAAERMIDVFASDGESNMAGVPHRNLQKRAMVLLSNSAKASGIEQPTPPEQRELQAKDDPAKAVHKYYLGWLKAHRAKLKLSDPWLEQLSRQKVD